MPASLTIRTSASPAAGCVLLRWVNTGECIVRGFVSYIHLNLDIHTYIFIHDTYLLIHASGGGALLLLLVRRGHTHTPCLSVYSSPSEGVVVVTSLLLRTLAPYRVGTRSLMTHSRIPSHPYASSSMAGCFSIPMSSARLPSSALWLCCENISTWTPPFSMTPWSSWCRFFP